MWVVTVTYLGDPVAKVPAAALPDDRVDVASATVTTAASGTTRAELNLLVDARTKPAAIELALPTAVQVAGNLGVPPVLEKAVEARVLQPTP